MAKIKQLLKGGLAEGKTLASFSKAEQAQIKAGTKVEMEHTNNKKVAQRIAMDHISEYSKYYTALKKMEVKLSKTKK
jgi:hypothetical protein